MKGIAVVTPPPAEQRPEQPEACRRTDLIVGSVLGLIARAQSDDVTARHALDSRFRSLARRAIARYRKDPVYEDLPGEAHLILVELLLEFDFWYGVEPFTYIRRKLPPRIDALVRQRRLERRRERPRSEWLPAETLEDDGEGSGDAALDGLLYRSAVVSGAGRSLEAEVIDRLVLQTAIDALPAGQRAVIELSRDGYQLVEIARVLHIKEAACQQRYHRGLARLRQVLEKES